MHPHPPHLHQINMRWIYGERMILAAAFIHFFTDIFLNISVFIKDWSESTLFMILDNYVQWSMLTVVFIVAVVFLYKKPARA